MLNRALSAAAALWLASTAPAQVAYSVRSNTTDHLYEINLATGLATDLGLVNFGDAEGLAFGPAGQLYTIGGTINEFWNITTPPGRLVGDTGPRIGIDAGLDFYGGVMYHTSASTPTLTGLYTVDVGTGAATYVADLNHFIDSIAIDPSTGVAYGIDAIFDDQVFTFDLVTGSTTLLGGLGLGNVSQQTGTAFGGGTLYALFGDGNLYTINLANGQATLLTQVRDSTGLVLDGWEGLAIIPVPGVPLVLGFAGLLAARRRR